eukprot:1139076-Pelagomonas_calceolata.AAC.4
MRRAAKGCHEMRRAAKGRHGMRRAAKGRHGMRRAAKGQGLTKGLIRARRAMKEGAHSAMQLSLLQRRV